MSLLSKFSQYNLECGTDEAGRGCLAGPVTAAAVILPDNFYHKDLNDSKQVSLKKRDLLKEIIIKEAICYSICHISEQEIDTINILNASIKAMNHSIIGLSVKPEFIIVDGNRFNCYSPIPFKTIIKGDSKYLSIAAASILAKTARDEYMNKLNEEFPFYNWSKNKGYPTFEHREAIKKFGLSPYHRKSFNQLPEQLEFDLK